MTAIVSEAERHRRAELIRDSRAALQQGETLEKRTQKRNAKADAWAVWFHQRMDLDGGDPTQFLPDALARLEQMIDDRVAAAVSEIKTTLRRALT
jgi:hypothetical protein